MPPSLLKQVEEAARAGNLEHVRKLVAVADALDEVKAGHPQSSPPTAPSVRGRWRTIGTPLITYLGYNLVATAHAYHAASTEAGRMVAEGCENAEVVLRMRSLSPRAAVTRRDLDGEGQAQVADRAFVLPHVYISDVLGRSEWTLTCHKTVRSGSVHTSFSSSSGTNSVDSDWSQRSEDV